MGEKCLVAGGNRHTGSIFDVMKGNDHHEKRNSFPKNEYDQ